VRDERLSPVFQRSTERVFRLNEASGRGMGPVAQPVFKTGAAV
jgi:hypothetical protein